MSAGCHNCFAQPYTMYRFHSDMDRASDLTSKMEIATSLATALIKVPNPHVKTIGIILGGTSVVTGYFSNTPIRWVIADGVMFGVGFTGVGTLPAIEYGIIRSLPQTERPKHSVRGRVRQSQMQNSPTKHYKNN